MPITKIYGLIGYPVKHSFSPAMHNAAFRYLDIDAQYRLFEIKPEELYDFFVAKLVTSTTILDINQMAISTSHIMGFNVTIPHKIRAKEILKEHWPIRQADFVNRGGYYLDVCGAVNTVKRAEGGWGYDNTDVGGFLRSVRQDLNIDVYNKNVFLIGCGGAGRAVIAALTSDTLYKSSTGLAIKQAKKIYVYDYNRAVAESTSAYLEGFKFIKEKLEFIPDFKIPEVLSQCDLLVNASPVGMNDDSVTVIKKEWLHKNLAVYDLVYNRETRLLRDAKSLGLPTASGLGMLLYQGVGAFEFWMEKEAPVEIMRKALLEECKKANIDSELW